MIYPSAAVWTGDIDIALARVFSPHPLKSALFKTMHQFVYFNSTLGHSFIFRLNVLEEEGISFDRCDGKFLIFLVVYKRSECSN
jgi:hypothetical protein